MEQNRGMLLNMVTDGDAAKHGRSVNDVTPLHQ